MQVMTRQPCYGDDSDSALFTMRSLTALTGEGSMRSFVLGLLG